MTVAPPEGFDLTPLAASYGDQRYAAGRAEQKALGDTQLADLQALYDAYRAAHPVTDPGWLDGWGAPVWRDDFDGDLSRWNVRNNDTANNMLERRMAANVKVSGGELVIEARREQIPGTPQLYTSGYIDTIGKDVQLRPGARVDIEALVPTAPTVGRGMWSALWLRADNAVGEIDLLEAYADKPDLASAWAYAISTVHEKTDGTGQHVSRRPPAFPDGQRPYQVFKTYGVELAADRLRFSIDGAVWWEPTVTQYPWLAPMLTATWNLRVNQQISKQSPPPPAPQYFYAPDAGTVFPRQMRVRSVRVYNH